MAGRKIGVLITGDRAQSGFPEFWYDTVAMYKMLQANGFNQNDLFILYGDGASWTPPCVSQRYTLPPMPANRFFSATRANIQAVFTALATGNPAWGVTAADAHDFLFVWTFDHGGQAVVGGVTHSTLCIWPMGPTDYILDTDFAAMVAPIANSHRCFCMQQCFSGGFVAPLQNASTVVLTAASANQVAWPGNQQDILCGIPHQHGDFNYYLLAATLRRTLVNFAVGINPDLPGGLNNTTSMYEAFQWVQGHMTTPSTPQYSDLGGHGTEMHLAAKRPVETPDIFTRDSDYDFGGVPSNPSTSLSTWLDAGETVSWESPDIWVSNDGVNPAAHVIPGITNFAMGRVGNMAATPIACTVSLYWADWNAGFNWPADYHLIGSQPVTIPALGTVNTAWIPFFVPLGVSTHVCLISRVTCPQDPVGTGTGPTDPLVIWDNNFSLHNVGAATGFAGEIRHVTMLVKNPLKKLKKVEISLEDVPDNIAALGASEKSKKLLVAGGKRAKLGVDDLHSIEVSLKPEEVTEFDVSFLILSESQEKAKVRLVEKIDGKVVGGCTYLIDAPPRKAPPKRVADMIQKSGFKASVG